MEADTEWATIGKIVALFGLKGELKVTPFTDVPNRFAQLDTVHIGPTFTTYKIKGVRPYKGEMLLLRLVGINDANAAEKLRNFDISIPLSQLAKLPPDSYYQHDILGLQVVTLAGRTLGTITDIIVTGSNDVYVVQGPEKQQILIPAIKEIVKQVDLIRQIMYIDPMKGLLDDEEAVTVDNDEPTEEASE